MQTAEEILEMMRGYQLPCVLAAAVDLDVFEILASSPGTAAEIAEMLQADLRAMTILLDALSAVGLLTKTEQRYSVPNGLVPLLTGGSSESVLAMLRHQANCLRRWSRLPWVVQSGVRDDPGPSIRGAEADQQAFIEAMHVVSREVAAALIREIRPGQFRCVLDLGGGSGTWTLAWLQAEPRARAIIFDLPHVIAMARERIASSPFAGRIALAAGDFSTDRLPTGADLVWVSAIIHQNSRQENRAMYRRIAAAIQPGGWIYIRDILMHPSRTVPLVGALFAVNMLAATDGGNTYTLAEIEEDLLSVGFTDVQLVRQDEGMHSVVRARRAEA
jgi:hypothetical protein